ncbi:MAG: hypothetical protein ACP5D7_05650 [Limnospira sp.]
MPTVITDGGRCRRANAKSYRGEAIDFMGVICDLVTTTLKSGYLSIEQENKLKQLLQNTKYSREDFDAFISLQNAAIDGRVRQESRELLMIARQG